MSSSFTLWNRIRRTPYQAVASVFMIFLTIFVMAVFLIMACASSAILSYFESKPQVTVFFKDEKNKSAVDQLMEKLKATGKVATMEYVSKDQALAIYREQNKNDPLLLEMVTADILPASLEVSATLPQYLSEIAEIVKQESGVDEVVYQKDVVDTLVSWTTTIRKIGIFFLVFLIMATFFIILTSIGMKIALKKEEIEILKLVGATPWYIKRPFIQEGMMYGLIGSAAAWVFASGALLYMRPFINSFLQGIPSLSIALFPGAGIQIWPFTAVLFIGLWVILTLAGLIIGLIGSTMAVSRYMKY